MSQYTAQQLERLSAMDIQVWQAKENKQESTTQDGCLVSTLDWTSLRERVAACELCALSKSRTQTVFGVGSETADIVFVGEAPGQREDEQGEPFVGRAGQLLENMLATIGLTRPKIYIANILKCRPPRNRDPSIDEVKACTPYLDRQLALMQPKVMVALGRIAAHYLLNTSTPLSRLRGREWMYGDTQIPLIVTYHPAYLLRSPREKRKSYIDLLKIKSLVS